MKAFDDWWADSIDRGEIAGVKLSVSSITVSKDRVRIAFEKWRLMNAPDARQVGPVEFTKLLRKVAPSLSEISIRTEFGRERRYVLPSKR